MNLGLLYINGQGVPQDHTKAIFFFRKAAEGNDSNAQYNLGWAYESGTGVDRNIPEAVRWYRKAAAGGSIPARNRLEGLPDENSLWAVLLRHVGLSSRQ
jgi:TPR repeat protein